MSSYVLEKVGTMTVYGFTAAGSGLDTNGKKAVISITIQVATDETYNVEEGTLRVMSALRSAANNAGISSLDISECRANRNTISPGGLPAALQIIER